MREQAMASGKTSDDVMRLGESVKQFFEDRLSSEAEILMNAEVDGFFTALATELRGEPSP